MDQTFLMGVLNRHAELEKDLQPGFDRQTILITKLCRDEPWEPWWEPWGQAKFDRACFVPLSAE